VFAREVLGVAVNRQVQLVNGGMYLRGLIEDGSRKSLERMVARLGGEADYQSLQQFLAVSPWDPGLVVRAVAERVAPVIDVQAWVLDDTGFPKDGAHSPGVKRQYSGTLGKIGNCQIGVSVHAVGTKGTVLLGWALYLPQEWCNDPEQFAFLRVRALARWQNGAELQPAEEWLICEWPDGHDEPLDYWISNLPADTPHEQLARLSRMRWQIELDYKQLNGELGLDHYEGRSWLGWYHHTARSSPPHTGSSPWSGRTQIASGRSNPAQGSTTAPAPLEVLDQPLHHLPATDQPHQNTHPQATTRVTKPTKYY
jgi:SRSO17 transposase